MLAFLCRPEHYDTHEVYNGPLCIARIAPWMSFFDLSPRRWKEGFNFFIKKKRSATSLIRGWEDLGILMARALKFFGSMVQI